MGRELIFVLFVALALAAGAAVLHWGFSVDVSDVLLFLERLRETFAKSARDYLGIDMPVYADILLAVAGILLLLVLALVLRPLFRLFGFLLPARERSEDPFQKPMARREKRAFLKEAQKHLKDGEFAEAGDCLMLAGTIEEAVDAYKQGGQLQRAAEALEQDGQTEEALALFEEAGDFPRAAELAIRLERLEVAAQLYEKQGTMRLAAETYERAGVLSRAGELYKQLEEFDAAAAAYERAGESMQAAAMYEQAFQQARAMGSGRRIEWQQLAQAAGRLYEESSQLEQAALCYEAAGFDAQAARVYESDARLEDSARLYAQAGELEKAADLYAKTGLTARSAELRGETHLREGRRAEAGQAFEEAGDHIRAAELYEEAGKLLEAAATYERAGQYLTAAGRFAHLGDQTRAARLYREGGRPDLAGQLYQEAGDLQTAAESFAEANDSFRAGLAHEAMGNQEQAIAALQQVPREASGFREAGTHLGKLFLQQGKATLARERLRQAIGEEDITVETLEAYWQLAACHEMEGQNQEALALYERIQAVDINRHGLAERMVACRAALETAPLRGEEDETQRYEIMEELGRGGMGVVHRATDRRLNRPVAYKVLNEPLLADPTALRRLLTEARTAAALNHPNIITIFDVGEAEGKPFLVMELAEGTTLQNLLQAVDRLPLLTTVKIFYQLCRAVAYAHSQDILHRDLKPGNVMVMTQDRVKIMDFGVAKVLGEITITQEGSRTGTPAYMSPEQIRGETLDPRSDLYSLGALLYELLTGWPPFPTGDIAYHHLHTPPKPPRQRYPDIPPPLEAICLRCLEKDRARRYSSADAMLKDLQKIARVTRTPSP